MGIVWALAVLVQDEKPNFYDANSPDVLIWVREEGGETPKIERENRENPKFELRACGSVKFRTASRRTIELKLQADEVNKLCRCFLDQRFHSLEFSVEDYKDEAVKTMLGATFRGDSHEIRLPDLSDPKIRNAKPEDPLFRLKALWDQVDALMKSNTPVEPPAPKVEARKEAPPQPEKFVVRLFEENTKTLTRTAVFTLDENRLVVFRDASGSYKSVRLSEDEVQRLQTYIKEQGFGKITLPAGYPVVVEPSRHVISLNGEEVAYPGSFDALCASQNIPAHIAMKNIRDKLLNFSHPSAKLLSEQPPPQRSSSNDPFRGSGR